MNDITQEGKQSKLVQAVTYATTVVNNKRFRSLLWLSLSFFIILGINSLLPVLEGEAHYTASPIETTYEVYVQMKKTNANFRLTWMSEQAILLYITQYKLNHPNLSDEEAALITAPPGFKVQVYTKFFFDSPFWYVSTAISIGSAVILYYALFNVLLVYAKDKDKKYLKHVEEVDKLVDNTLDPNLFEPWMDETFNRNRKISQHKRNIRFELDRLYKRTNYEIRRGARNYFKVFDELKTHENYADVDESQIASDALHELKGSKRFKRRVKHYIKQREQLLSLLDPKYIEEYVIDGYVKNFKYIYPMFVYSGTSKLEKTTDSYSTITTDAVTLKKDAFFKVFYSVVIVLLFAVALTVTAVSSHQQDPFWVVMNVVGKIAPLLLQIPLAIDYSAVFMDKQLISNLIHRRTIAMLFAADVQKKGGVTHA